jgi:hypothetical protein
MSQNLTTKEKPSPVERETGEGKPANAVRQPQ